MVWLGAITVGILISVIDMFLLSNEKNIKRWITVLLRDSLISILSAMALADTLLGVKNIFAISSQRISYSWKFLGIILAIGVIFLIVSGFIKRVFVFEFNPKKQKRGTLALKIVSAILFALGVAAYTGTIWGKEAFGELSPDQIIINLNSPIEGTDIGVYISLFSGPVLKTILFTVLYCTFVFPQYKLVYNKGEKHIAFLPEIAIKIVSVAVAIVMLICGCAFGIERFQLTTLFDSYLNDSSYIEDNFTDPETTKLTFPKEKRNLIFIYLESIENTFFSKDLGGYFEENYMPDLAQLSKEGISFSHKKSGFGGPLSTFGSGWSVAAMVNMNTGLPMKVPVDGNSYGAPDNFLPGATTLGDILYEQGYEQSVMFGADAAFGGLNFFFESHGDFNILDHKGVIEQGWLPEHYNVWWGYEDDKLYEFAKTELSRLASLDRPFHFVMETADTHAPDGYLSPNAEKKYNSQYANCIYYSQAEAVKFVRWIQQQDFYENTTIVIIGDHLSMADSFVGDITNYRRTTYNLFLNLPENLQSIPAEHTFNRKWASFDMFPTTLASIGVEIEGNRLGIGTNMFSDQETIIERDGFSKVNEELKQRSTFYNNNILVDLETVGKQ